MRILTALALLPAIWAGLCPARADEPAAGGWRALPLVQDGKVHPDWVQVGYGRFAVEDGALRAEPDERGLGLLLYRKETFGDCQIRVVFRPKDAKANSGVFVRIDEGILKKLDERHPPARRDKAGKLTKESLAAFMDASEKGLGPWYAVHHGYEVQICDAADAFHRTGSIYSLAKAEVAPERKPSEWRTMVVTLQGDRVLVDIDGKRVTTFDPAGKEVPKALQWYEPKREPKRPQAGYIGLQTHDPGDVVYFKEVSVRPLDKGK